MAAKMLRAYQGAFHAEGWAMPDDDLMQRMRGVAGYREMVKTLREGAIGAAIFGAVFLWGAYETFQEFPLLATLALGFAILLPAYALVSVFMATPACMIIHGLVFCLVGVWNIGVALLELPMGGPSGGALILVGIFQIVFGVSFFRRYGRFARLAASRPDKAVLRELDGIAKEILKAKLRKSEDIIQFDSKTFIQVVRWRVRFSEGIATFVAVRAHDMIFARPDEVDIEQRGQQTLGKKSKVTIRLPGKTIRTVLTEEALGKLNAWKESADGAEHGGSGSAAP